MNKVRLLPQLQDFFIVLYLIVLNKVRKLFESVEMEVSRLKRTRFGPIFLPSTLKIGTSLELDDNDISSIKEYGTHQGI